MGAAITQPVRKFLEAQPIGTVATLRPSGKIRHTVVYYVIDADRILISTEAKRGKARDVTRTGWASFCVFGHEKPFPAVTIEGPARILTAGIAEPTARILQKIRGQKLIATATDEQLASVGRVILEIAIEHVYSVQYIT
jgi:PPOX class probable F420-dependent enzyme